MYKESMHWKNGAVREVLSTPVFSVDTVHRTHPDGREGEFVVMRNRDWVGIIPWVLRDGVPSFVMVEQYRHGSESVTREFPAGLIDEGESAEEAARRELKEETGMEGELIELSSFNPNPAFMTNRQSFFLAVSPEVVSAQDLDENEEIDTVIVAVEEVIRDMGSGLYDNGIMVAAMGVFLRYAEKHSFLRGGKK